MNLKSLIPLCLSLVVGVIVAKLAYNQIQKNKTGATSDGKLTQVVVVRDSVAAGEEITPDKLQMGKVSVDNVPDGAFMSIDQLKGRVALVTLNKSQAVAENFLAPSGTGAGLQFAIPTGMRAISIEVNEFSGVGGMLLPGCHVDLLSTVPAEQGGEMMSRTVVQNVQIIAVGQRMVSQAEKKGDEPTAFRSVTLLATPAESEAIELAAATGRPRLVLRAGTDKDITQTAGVTASNLRGHQASRKIDATPVALNSNTPSVEPAPMPIYSSVQVIRGTVESEVRFDNGWLDLKSTAQNRNGYLRGSTTQPSNSNNVTNTDTNSVSGTDTAPASGDR
ncbi:MAG: Flp pilus assembly protein CpaB [Anaerolineae bacterium]|nr:Flp pilus assembly protein CpaB [Phycisphaerae bacterium]